MSPLLEVRELLKVFPLQHGTKIHAVEKVSFYVNEAETLAIVGESGCGKSTLAYLICRLQEASGGKIILDGQDVTRLDSKAMREHRRKVQIVFQDPFASLDPRRTVGYAVSEPLLVHRVLPKGQEMRDQVQTLFERVGLDGSHMDKFPHQLSGGQRQRISIARALALRPKLVIADEAVSALDVTIQAQVINLMMELQREMRLSFLFITHDLAVVERMAHRVAVMYLGQIVEIGPRSAIYENPTHSYTKRLLDAAPIADPRRRRERPLLTGEVPTSVWTAEESPEPANLIEIEPGHFAAEE